MDRDNKDFNESDEKGERQIKYSKANLATLKRDVQERLTDIRAEGDMEEDNRRIKEEQRKEERGRKIDNEVYENYQRNLATNMQWEKLQTMENCEELAEAITIQHRACDDILVSKKTLITDLQKELKINDDEYVKSLKKMGIDIDKLLETMGITFVQLRDQYADELRGIENAFLDERKNILDRNTAEIKGLFDEHARQEETYLQNRIKKQEAFEDELDESRKSDANKFAKLKRDLETELQTLEKYLEDMKAVYQLNEEKLDFNEKVLVERVRVNEQTITNLKRKKQRLVELWRRARDNYHAKDKIYKDNNYLYTENYKSAAKQFKKLQKKFKHFKKADQKRFNEIWDMNEQEVNNLIDKIIKADKVIHVQQLGLPWTPPTDPTFGYFEGGQSVMHQSTSIVEGSRQVGKSEGGEEQSMMTMKGLEEQVPIERLRQVFKLIKQEAPFLLEGELDNVDELEEMTKGQAFYFEVEALCKALSIEKTDIPILVEAFYCRREMKVIEEMNEEAEDEESKVLPKKEASISDLREDDDDRSIMEEDDLEIDPDLTLEILMDFQQRRKEDSESIDTAGNPRNAKKKVYAETPQQKDERLKKEEKRHWEKKIMVLNEYKLNLWNALYSALSKYYNLLQDRQNLIEETGMLNQQNEELKTLLNQYLLAGVNRELNVPPGQTIKLDINQYSYEPLPIIFNIFSRMQNEQKKKALESLKMILRNSKLFKSVVGVVFREIDTDGSGSLDIKEVHDFFMRQIVYSLEENKPDTDRIGSIFKELDRDKSGSIDMNELGEFLRELFKEQRKALALELDEYDDY